MSSTQTNSEDLATRAKFFERAQQHLTAGQYRDCIVLCEQGLSRWPHEAGLQWLLGRCLIAQRKLQRAEAVAKTLLEQEPSNTLAAELLGDVQLAQGSMTEARSSFELALSLLKPEQTKPRAKLEEKLAYTAQQPTANENSAEMQGDVEQLAEAERLKAEGKGPQAEEQLRAILRRNPRNAEAIRQLAAIASEHFEYADAVTLLERAVSEAPRYARAWLDLSNAQLELGNYPEALRSADEVVALNPEIAEAYICQANARAKANDHEGSINAYRDALKIAPRHDGAFSGLAHQLKTIGQQGDAIDTHRAAIEANPRNSEAYWNLANMKTFRFHDEEVAAMEALLTQELESLSRAQINNALGLEYEARKDYERAFAHFRACNEAKRETERYDPVAHELHIEDQMATFTPEFVQSRAAAGAEDPSPIFIVGLPRSGSTLLEQILASHSQVEGTHELPDLPHLVHSLNKGRQREFSFPKVSERWPEDRWEIAGQHYLDRTQKYRSDTPMFIDKNPNNFVNIGLIRLAMPNAKIINARRHPMDSCLGTYKQLFAGGQPFSYDLIDLGEYYVSYQELMDHWHTVMPGAVLDVYYEDVVADLETQVRRLLDYCGLPFEESCLSFHDNKRAVRTASSEQVRQPIYSSSVHLWKRYGDQLDELAEILEPVISRYPHA